MRTHLSSWGSAVPSPIASSIICLRTTGGLSSRIAAATEDEITVEGNEQHGQTTTKGCDDRESSGSEIQLDGIRKLRGSSRNVPLRRDQPGRHPLPLFEYTRDSTIQAA